MNEFMDLKMGW